MPEPSIAHDAFESAPTGLIIVDAQGVVEHCNAVAKRIAHECGPAGCGPGAPLALAFPADHAALVKRCLHACLHDEPAAPVRVSFRTTDVEVELRFARLGADRCVVSIIDIEGTRDADRRLRENEQRLAAHFMRTPLASIEWNIDRTARLWNPSAERIFGYTADEAAARDLFPALVAPESRAAVDRVWKALCEASGGESITNTNITKDGRTILCRWYNTPLRDASGNVVGVASLAEDITETALAERKVRESERRLRSIVDRLPVLVWALDERQRPVFWNEHAQSASGLPADQVLAPGGAARIFPADARALDALLAEDFDAVERPLRCADGSVRRVLWSNVAARCPVPGWAAWGVGIDVTELQEARRAARESERRFRDVFHAVELAGIIIDPTGRLVDCNAAMLEALERERDELIGHDWFEIGCPAEARTQARAELESALARGVYQRRHERQVISKSGRVRDMVWTRSLLRDGDGRPVAACAFGLDVTDRLRAEAELAKHRDELETLVESRTEELAESTRQLAQAERLASIGHLAAGVGHDINNILLPVRCHLDAIREHDDIEVVDAVDAVSTGLSVLAHLGESLRRMTRRDAGSTVAAHDDDRAAETPAVLDLAEWWARAGPLVSGAIPDAVRFEASFNADLPGVRVDANELTQAVLNLVINASEAIEPSDPGLVTLRVSADGEDVAIEVHDNGCGMDEEIARRAVEPFFSTKTRAMSTGLGLSIVHAFARSAGGDLGVASTPGEGSTVTLRLPPAEGLTPEHEPADPPTHRGIAVVSIADPRLRAIHQGVLRDLGWDTVEPADAPPRVDLLVTDDGTKPEILIANHTFRLVSDSKSSYHGNIDVRSSLAELRAIYSRHPGSTGPAGT